LPLFRLKFWLPTGIFIVKNQNMLNEYLSVYSPHPKCLVLPSDPPIAEQPKGSWRPLSYFTSTMLTFGGRITKETFHCTRPARAAVRTWWCESRTFLVYFFLLLAWFWHMFMKSFPGFLIANFSQNQTLLDELYYI